MSIKYIGYWRREKKWDFFPFSWFYEYPFPYSHNKELFQGDIIQRSLHVLENEGDEYILPFHGEQYTIPFGYFHYLRDHNVKVDDDLIAIVEYYENL